MTRFDAATSGIATPQLGERMLARNWVRYAMIALISGDLAYFFAAAPLGLPSEVVLLFGFAFGPLLSLAFVGLYYSVCTPNPSPSRPASSSESLPERLST